MCLKNHLSISWFQFSFQMGRGDTPPPPLPDPPPARHFVPRTRASPLFMTIHAPSTKSWIRHWIYREREVRGTYIGGFPEPERAIRGTPEALRVLRWKVCCAEDRFGRGCSGDRFGRGCSGDRFGRVYRGKIRQLDLTIVDYCMVKYICAGINAASQEVFSTSNNRSVCVM